MTPRSPTNLKAIDKYKKATALATLLKPFFSITADLKYPTARLSPM